MSQLQAFDASQFNARTGSQLQAFGPAFRTFETSMHDYINVQWTVDKFIWDVGADTLTPVGKGNVIEGPYFRTSMAVVATDAGKNEQKTALTLPFDGTPQPLTDTVSSNGLTLNPRFSSSNTFGWGGWTPHSGGYPNTAFWEDTGTSLKLRGEVTITAGSGAYAASPDGFFCYGHPHLLNFNGFNWVPETTLEWITLYFTGLGGHNIGTPGGGSPNLRLLVRYEVEISPNTSVNGRITRRGCFDLFSRFTTCTRYNGGYPYLVQQIPDFEGSDIQDFIAQFSWGPYFIENAGYGGITRDDRVQYWRQNTSKEPLISPPAPHDGSDNRNWQGDLHSVYNDGPRGNSTQNGVLNVDLVDDAPWVFTPPIIWPRNITSWGSIWEYRAPGTRSYKGMWFFQYRFTSGFGQSAVISACEFDQVYDLRKFDYLITTYKMSFNFTVT